MDTETLKRCTCIAHKQRRQLRLLERIEYIVKLTFGSLLHTASCCVHGDIDALIMCGLSSRSSPYTSLPQVLAYNSYSCNLASCGLAETQTRQVF